MGRARGVELMAAEEAVQSRTHLRPALLAQTMDIVLHSGKACQAGQAELYLLTVHQERLAVNLSGYLLI